MPKYIKGGPTDEWVFPGNLYVKGTVTATKGSFTTLETQHHTHYVGEIPTKLTSKRFKTLHDYTTNTLAVYLNGLREINIIEISSTEFEFTEDLGNNNIVLVDYIKIEV